MRKTLLLIAIITTCVVNAQSYIAGGIKEIVECDKNLAGNKYSSYFAVFQSIERYGETVQTAPPDGYEPFYLSSFARHGARFLNGTDEYDAPIKYLTDANSKGVLSEQGKVLLSELKQVRALCPKEKLGTLTPIGAAQHKAIAQRMCKNFPEIFNETGSFFAQSSVSKRCIKSMNAEIAVIDSVTHQHITQASGRKGMQDRLAGNYNNDKMEAARGPGYSAHAKERSAITPYQRICGMLFKNTTWTTVDKQKEFVRGFFEIASNMQSHDFGIDLWKYFTDDEACTLWHIKNRLWYRMFGPSPVTKGLMPLRSKWQLEDIIEGADSVVNRKNWHGGNLRFSHDTSLMPLVCLMELGTTGKAIPEAEIDEVDKYFRNQEIFCMAGNIQLVFYRPINGKGDILVKALLCEREVTLPGTPVMGPYYRWNEIRTHWLNRVKV